MINTDYLKDFDSFHLCSGLSEAQREIVRRNSHMADLIEGESLFFQGDDASSFYLVLSGRIKLFRVSPDGKEKVVDILEAGESFAEALMFMDAPHYPVTASALESSRVIGINCREFKAMLRDSVDSCFVMLGKMSQRLHHLIREIDALSLETGTVRTISYLLHQAPPDRDSFQLTVAKNVIASRLSIKPETLSRILKHLHDQDIVSIEGRQVTIHDRAALESAAAHDQTGTDGGGRYARMIPG